jgi:hypothetical protein
VDVPAIVAIIGGIAFLVGLLGGGIEAAQVKIPQLPRWLRFLSSLMGVALIGIAIWLSFATSAPQTLTPTPTRPSPVQQVTPEPSTRTDVPGTRQLLTAPEIDAALGAGNWECFPDRLDGVALIDVPPDLVITNTISEVDKQGVKYTSGQIVPSGGNATVWLNGELSDRQQCPNP